MVLLCLENHSRGTFQYGTPSLLYYHSKKNLLNIVYIWFSSYKLLFHCSVVQNPKKIANYFWVSEQVWLFTAHTGLSFCLFSDNDVRWIFTLRFARTYLQCLLPTFVLFLPLFFLHYCIGDDLWCTHHCFSVRPTANILTFASSHESTHFQLTIYLLAL